MGGQWGRCKGELPLNPNDARGNIAGRVEEGTERRAE